MRNRIPSDALPGSRSLKIGTNSESTKEKIAIERSEILLHVETLLHAQRCKNDPS
jgi:hypothetical protein